MDPEALRILAIDDNQDNLIVLKAVMKDAFPQASVFTALNGKKGLEIAQAENPDVILLDIVMPQMDGYEVCRFLKQDDLLRNIPVVFLTALRTDRESRIRALEVGAEAFLTKPFDEAELTAQVRAMAKIKAANDLKRLEKEQLATLVTERTQALQKELDERCKVEMELRQANQELENRRSATLKLLEDLKQEVATRMETEKKLIAALNDKEILLRELYHRTRNNMQVICSMMEMQATSYPHSQASEFVHAVEPKIRSMALMHHKLYQSQDLSRIDLKDYLVDLAHLALQSYRLSPGDIQLNLDFQSIPVLIDVALPCGLVVNELLSNAMKYAFPDGQGGIITMRLFRTETGAIELHIADNGVGVPESFDFRAQPTLGLQTIFTLVEYQLQGEIQVNGQGGVAYTIQFRDDLYSARV